MGWDHKNKYSEGLEALDQAIAIDPNFAYAGYNKGNMLWYMKRCDEAIGAYEKALNSDPNYTEAKTGRDYAVRMVYE